MDSNKMDSNKDSNKIKEEGNIGAVEFKSIARGIFTTDAMLKEANVSLVFATTLCPGKYLSIVEGEVSAVRRAVEAAERVGARHVFSSFVISRINIEVIDAISGKTAKTLRDSIGVVESLNMANLISAADISLDSADVDIVELRLGKGCGVNSFYVLTGDITSIKESVKNAVEFLASLGSLIAYRTIAYPDSSILKWLEGAKCFC